MVFSLSLSHFLSGISPWRMHFDACNDCHESNAKLQNSENGIRVISAVISDFSTYYPLQLSIYICIYAVSRSGGVHNAQDVPSFSCTPALNDASCAAKCARFSVHGQVVVERGAARLIHPAWVTAKPRRYIACLRLLFNNGLCLRVCVCTVYYFTVRRLI